MENTALGFHGIWDVFGVDPEIISYRNNVEPLLEAIAERLKLSVLNASYKQFEPVGVTGVYLLSESHLSIHTWPERAYAAIDLFSCAEFNPKEVEAIIREILEPQRIESQVIKRGQTRAGAAVSSATSRPIALS